MQDIAVISVVLGLFVFLFSVVSRARPDDRLRLWVGIWICILSHFAAELWQPRTPWLQVVQAILSIDALALAAILFAVSSMILTEGRAKGLRLAGFLAVPTFLCLDLAIAGIAHPAVLAAVVIVRQSLAIKLAMRARENRRLFLSVVAPVGFVTGCWMLHGIFHQQPDVVIAAILGEVYFVAAVDFFGNGWQHSVGHNTMVAGLLAWSAVFPCGYWMDKLWPSVQIEPEIWNVPKFCVIVGMILIVMEEDARAARELGDEYRLLFDSNPNALWITDVATKRLLAVNQTALDMHGYTQDEFLALKLPEILHPEMHELVLSQIANPDPVPNRASIHLRKDGTTFPIDLSAHNITFHGRLCRFVMAIDVSEREALQKQLDAQAGRDHLTGLPNRVGMPELLTEAVEQALKTNQKIAILSIDMDRFKGVNDAYGMRVGDEYIQRIAARLTTCSRSMDIVARTGGDEFTLVLNGVRNPSAVDQSIRQIMDAFAEPVVVQGYEIQLSVSIGVAMCPEDGKDAASLWRNAESARTQAKLDGGNTAVWVSSELKRAAEEQIALESYIRSHLNDGGFYLLYQPLYDMEGTVQGLEALIRLEHPELGAVSPVKLIPVAESSGLIIPLGDWVIEEVCRQILVWKSQGLPIVPVAVNISGKQLMHIDFASNLMSKLERFAIDPRWIHLEVTESLALNDASGAAERMALLSEQGIAFSIDDFGTGHSSFARLSQLRASVLKIDRSFITPTCSERAHSIVQAIVTMAHALGHKVVAEGVEAERQIACLRQLNCDLLQGFVLSRPVPAGEIPALITATHPMLKKEDDEQATNLLHLVQCTTECRTN